MPDRVGVAYVEVLPSTSKFEAALHTQLAGSFTGVTKTAEAAGAKTGEDMARGFAGASGKVASEAEKAGATAGQRMGKGFHGGLSTLFSGLASVGVPLQTFGGNVEKAAGKLGAADAQASHFGSTMAGVGGKLIGVSAAVGVAVGAAGVDAAIKYEKVGASIAAAAGISTGAAKQISDAFLTTAGKADYSAREIGAAYSTVAGELGTVAGHALSSGEAMKVMAAAQNLALGTGKDLTSTTEALGKVMLSYQVPASQAAHATDVLFAASKQTGTEVDQLAAVLNRMHGRLGALSPSLAETGGLMELMAKHGITGRQSLTALNGVFTQLVGGSKQATDMAKALGVQIFDNTGKFVGVEKVISQLQPKLAGLSQQQQLQATKALFGAQASKQLLGIILEGPNAFQKATSAVQKHGSAEEAAKKQSETLEGQWKKLRATLEDLAVKVGNILIPVLGKVVAAVKDVIGWFGKHEAVAKTLAATLTVVLGGAIGAFVAVKVAAFVGGIQNMIAFCGKLVAQMGITAGAVTAADGEMAAATEAAAGAMDAALMGTLVGAVLVGVSLAVYELVEHWQEAWDAIKSATETVINALIDMINELLEPLNTLSGVLNSLTGINLGEVKIGHVNLQGGEGGAKPGALSGSAYEGMYGKPGAPGSAASQKEFGATLAGLTGLSPKVVGKWLAAEQPEGSPATPGSNNWLNVQYTDQGPNSTYYKIAHAKTGTQAAIETAEWLKKQPGLAGILHAAGHGEAAELHAIQSSGWASSAYGGGLGGVKGYQLPKAAKDTEHFSNAIKEATEATKKHTAATHHAASTHHAATKAVEQYVSPFSRAGHVTRGRTDQGVDFSFSGPLAAIGAGTVARIVQDPGGFGEEIVEKLTSGARKGQYVYYGLETGASGRVRQGQHLAAGQTVATGKGSGGIELGFASSAQGVPITPVPPGVSHNVPTVGGTEFSKFLGTLHKGGVMLETASAEFASAVKMQTADKKAGEAEYRKIDQAIQSGSMKDLVRVVGDIHQVSARRVEGVQQRGASEMARAVRETHFVTMKQIEADHKSALGQLLTRLQSYHQRAMSDLAEKLVRVHQKALESMVHAMVRKYEEEQTKRLAKDERLLAEGAEATAQATADATRVTIDRASEAGLAGSALTVAHARTVLDETKRASDAAIAAAKHAVTLAEGTGELNEARAKYALAEVEASARTTEADRQKELELSEDQNRRDEEQKRRESEDERNRENERKNNEGAQTAAVEQHYSFTIYGGNASAQDILGEMGWLMKTGTLPAAQPFTSRPVLAVPAASNPVSSAP